VRARQAEIERLRARVAQLEAANASLRKPSQPGLRAGRPTTNERRAGASLSQEMPWWRSAPGWPERGSEAPSEMTGKMFASFQVGSMLDQS